MKENMLAVLMYLFEHHIGNHGVLSRDQHELIDELEQAGFRLNEINQALRWLEGLTEIEDKSQHLAAYKTVATRIYAPFEQEKIGVEGYGLLYRLEQIGVLNPLTREMVIDRAMALDGGEIDLARLKWVVLIVLFNQPGQEAQLAWMEDYVLNERESESFH